MKVLVAVDGSFHSQKALEALRSVKWADDTEIKLIATVKSADVLPFGGNEHAHSMPEALQITGKQMQAVVAQLAQATGLSVTSTVLQGDPKTLVVQEAKNWPADLIFMGSRGRKGVELILLGSVSQAVLMQAQCPVVIVKSDPDQPAQPVQFKKILVTVDNSPYSEAAMQWLKKLNWGDTQFRLVTVVQPLPEVVSESEVSPLRISQLAGEQDKLIASARESVQKWAAELGKAFGSTKVASEIGQGDPREVILRVAENWSADLIVMGSHGRTGLNKLLLGSVSQAVAVQGFASVAIVKGIVPKGQGGLKATGMFTKVPDKK